METNVHERRTEPMNVIYLAGGKGIRAGLGYPKQYARIKGKPIIIYGLEILHKIPEIDKIIIVHDNNPEYVQELIERYGILKTVLVPGGRTRQESVRNGLTCVDSEYVLIAEAVRPFITTEFVQKVISTDGDFVTPWKSCISTVLTLSKQHLHRDLVGEVQMPQKYKTSILRTAHYKTRIENASDDAALVIETLGLFPTIIEGIEQNIKITTPLDLKIANAIYDEVRE